LICPEIRSVIAVDRDDSAAGKAHLGIPILSKRPAMAVWTGV
jgi:hypothetical protein